MRALFLCSMLLALPARADDEDGRSETRAPFTGGETLETIATRPGVKLAFALTAPSGTPRGIAILLAGGDGVLALSPSGYGASADNFVVRIRGRFVAAGFATAVVDAPSDRPRGLDGFRTSEPHARDLHHLIDWLGKKWRAPIYLVGTSRGTISIANAMARGEGSGVAGIVLTSSVTTGKKESIADVAVEKITGRVLLAHHEKDQCNASPLDGAERLAKKMNAKLERFQGGDPPRGKPCGPLSPHGFLGLDEKVTRAILEWIEQK
jgi:hypothetical protein